MNDRASRERALRKENARMKAALSAIHDALHANEVDRAHELCECAIEGESVAQPNISVGDSARGMAFAAQFNQLAQSYGQLACCVTLVPSKTVPNAVSLQICGSVEACKVVESMIRGRESTYMGDHEKGCPDEG
jgi:precorrin-3B methylase